MAFPVTYYCPHCGTLVALERDGYLADKAVTPYPFEGWRYVSPTEPFEEDAADGVRFVCGESDGVEWAPDRTTRPTDDDEAIGCGEPFYLSFVRYEEGREIDPRPETELVEIDPASRPAEPRGSRGLEGPDGSDGFR